MTVSEKEIDEEIKCEDYGTNLCFDNCAYRAFSCAYDHEHGKPKKTVPKKEITGYKVKMTDELGSIETFETTVIDLDMSVNQFLTHPDWKKLEIIKVFK